MYKKIVNILILEIILVIISTSLFFVRNDIFNDNSTYSFFEKKYIDLKSNVYTNLESDRAFKELDMNGIDITNDGLKIKNSPWITIEDPNKKIVSIEITTDIGDVADRELYYKIYFDENGNFSENNIQVEKVKSKVTNINLNKLESKVRLDFVNFDKVLISKVKINTAKDVVNVFEKNFSLIFSIIFLALNLIVGAISYCKFNDKGDLVYPIKKFYLQFKEYIKDKRLLIISIIFISLITYSVEIFKYTFSVDETLALGRWDYFTEWIYNGRFSITIFKSLFMLFGIFPPVFTSFVSIILLSISSIFWLMLVERSMAIQIKSYFKELIFCGIFLTLPFVVPEYIIFNTFSIEVSLTLMFLPMGIWFLINYIEEIQEKYELAYGMIIIFFSIGVYQNFLSMIFIIIIIKIYSLFSLQETSNKHYMRILKRVTICLFILFGAILVYGLVFKITLMLMPHRESLYISGFSGIKENFKLLETLKLSFFSIYYFIKSHNDTGSVFYIISTIMLIIISIIELIRIKGIWKKTIFTINTIMLLLAPYTVWLAMLAPYGLPARSMHSLMLFCALCWYIVISIIEHRGFSIQVKTSVVIFGIIILLFQSQYTSRVLYGDQIRLEQDAQIIHNIFDRVEEDTSISGKTIAFLNSYIPQKNNTILNGEIIGKSLLEWDATRRDFIYSLGYPNIIKILNEEEKKYYESVIPKSWPNEGCILEEEDLIVVRLG